MSEENPTLDEIIIRAMHYKAVETRHALPGRIKSYDANKGLAEVEVCVNPTIQKDGGDDVEVLGVIKNVPIEWMSGGGYFVAFPLNAGDPVKITFHDFSIDQWIEKGGVVTTDDQRTHHLSDASAYPGMRAKPQALPSGHGSKLIIGKIDNPSLQMQIDDSFFLFGGAAAQFLARADKVQARLDALYAIFSAWTPVPNDGGAVLKSALSSGGWAGTPGPVPPNVNAVACDKVKAE
jgi:hypothetical protein